MEPKSRKRLRIDLEVENAEGRIELPDRDDPVEVSMSKTHAPPPPPPDDVDVSVPPTVVERPYLGASIIWDYQLGLRKLLQLLDQRDPCYLEVLTLQARFADNERTSRAHGSSEEQRMERSRIVESLNHIALVRVGISFNDLCQCGT
jgi:hypothetical protein